ncbi:hypothetical protein V5O48_007086 [Marasmius crinis-equi]|uniref:F-box domain-containing protein n=1 Tax=Marasmius crinis-equi TaxID=585013 RepID=A0ABR3FI55_9AGAR
MSFSLTPPANRMPPEVLSEIFLHGKDNALDAHAQQWIVGSVCRQWREVSLKTKRLWATMHLPIVPSRCFLINATERLQTVIDRVANAKLHLRLDFTTLEDAEPLESFLTLLFSTSDAWESLTIRIYGYGSICLGPFMADKRSFSSLRAVTVDDWEAFYPKQDFLLALNHSPQLRSVSLFRRNSPFPLPIDTAPNLFHSLTPLEVDPFGEPWCLLALEQCRHLRTLVIRRTISLQGRPVNVPSIRLPTVQRLQVSLYDDVRLAEASQENILDFLLLPALKELDVAKSPVHLDANIDSLISLIERSKCTLGVISVSRVTLRDITIERLLRSTPTVSTLSLQGLLLPHLFNAITSGALLPDLRHLAVSHPDNDCFPGPTITAISALVSTRRNTLKSVRLNVFPNSSDTKAVVQFKGNQASVGPELFVSYREPRLHLQNASYPRTVADAFARLLWEPKRFLFERKSSLDCRLENLAENLPLIDQMLTFMEETEDGLADCCVVSSALGFDPVN